MRSRDQLRGLHDGEGLAAACNRFDDQRACGLDVRGHPVDDRLLIFGKCNHDLLRARC